MSEGLALPSNNMSVPVPTETMLVSPEPSFLSEPWVLDTQTWSDPVNPILPRASILLIKISNSKLSDESFCQREVFHFI
jgi:hypothetical protein